MKTEKTRYNCLVILGPTASGKTGLACRIAEALQGEILSADSRQVYRGLDIGTGKDLDSYHVNGKKVPLHLVDIADPKQQFYLHEFAAALDQAFELVQQKKKLPVICGGSGLYLDVIRNDYALTQVPENQSLRSELAKLDKEQLLHLLAAFPDQYACTDRSSVKRLIRGIEIGTYLQNHHLLPARDLSGYHPYYVGISADEQSRKQNIRKRLLQRLESGMLDEARTLLLQGVSHERMEKFGLEYKFMSLHLRGILGLDDMTRQLEQAIWQFSRRQMTWFRKMEKEGVTIHWITNEDPEKIINVLRPLFSHLNPA